MTALHMMAVAGAARLLLRKAALCAQRGFCELLLLPPVAARAAAPAKAASFQRPSVHAVLDALFQADSSRSTPACSIFSYNTEQ